MSPWPKHRLANLTEDREEIVAFLYDNLTKASNAARFDWLYLHGPFGEARAWIAADPDSGRTIGFAAAFPRQFRFETTEHRTWVLGDFCISPDARSLGPAVQLQRFCLASLGDAPWYDFPSQSMMAIYKRLGSFTFEDQVRYAKLLRIDRKPVGSALHFVGNALLQLRSRPAIARGLELSQLEGPFTSEFDSVSPNEIHGVRSAEFLNWRFRQHPIQKFIVIVAKRNAELLGYAVLTMQDGNGTICDITAVEENVTFPALLSYAEDILFMKGAHTISGFSHASSRLPKYFKSAGFRPRENHPMVLHGLKDCLLQPADRDS